MYFLKATNVLAITFMKEQRRHRNTIGMDFMGMKETRILAMLINSRATINLNSPTTMTW